MLELGEPVTEAGNMNDVSRPQNPTELLDRALARARWELLGAPVAAGGDDRDRDRVVPGGILAGRVAVAAAGRARRRAGRLRGFGGGGLHPTALVRFPTRTDGLRRLDRNTALIHRPATAIGDELATPKADLWSAVLWRTHVERALLAARNLKAGQPSPRLDKRDPTALRALVLMLAVATFVAAGSERGRRIAAAFDWQGVTVPANFRLDAWVSPPTYTAKPPVILPACGPASMAADVGCRRVGPDRQRADHPGEREGRFRRRHHRRRHGDRPRAASAGSRRYRGTAVIWSPTVAPRRCRA